MKFIDIRTYESKDDVLSYIKNNDKVNEGVRFEDRQGGKPHMHIKEKDGKLKIKCEMIGRPTKDNGFLTGTIFRGSISEEDGVTRLKGVITTSFIYHLIMIGLAIFWVVFMLLYSAYQFITFFVLLGAFEFFFFKDEFKKQGYISRYLVRAIRRLEKEKSPRSAR